MKKFLFLLAASISLFILNGCVGMPPVKVSEGIKSEELASHVKFLSQPAMKGRKPKTSESVVARKYIEARFKAYGLVPWGQEKSYEQYFGYGTNVIGVLTGSEPNLRDEFVLVSAHYDHIGKNKKGQICPGAGDNASGVAALLAIAEQMSFEKPKRPIVFAAFDCEEMMLFGSFAFNCRKDVNDAKIAAVVNIDILGRDFLNVVRNNVLAAGTEGYPQIREKICELGKQHGIRMSPIGTDFVGPMGDHVAFESRPIPCLFFTSGTYKDYHKPTDTADKLNFTDIEKSTKVICEIVKDLANDDAVKRTGNANDGYAEELETLNLIISDVKDRFSETGLSKEDLERCEKLDAQVKNFLTTGGYEAKIRMKIMGDTTELLAKYMLPVPDKKATKQTENEKEFTELLPYFKEFYYNYRKEVMLGYKKLVEHVLKYQPDLFRGMPKFEYELYEIPPENISIRQKEPERFILNVLPDGIEVTASKTVIFQAGIVATLEPLNCEGTKQQLADFCLLKIGDKKQKEIHAKEIKKVLGVITGQEPNGNYEELVNERLKQGSFKNKAEWVCSCISGDSPELSKLAIELAKKDNKIIREGIAKVITDKDKHPDVRAEAIKAVEKDRNELLALCDVLDDNSPAVRKDYFHVFRKDYPFSDRIIIKTAQPEFEKIWQKNPDAAKTLSDLSQEQLKKITKKNFSKDSLRWRKWIEKNIK